MANVPISFLPAVTPPVTGSALVPIVVGGVTDKTTVAQLVTGLPDGTPSASGLLPTADKTKLDAATDANTAGALVKRDGSGNFSANVITMAQGTVTGTPSAGTDIANKAYVDATAAGLIIKAAVRVATTGTNITLAGSAPNTLDGLSLVLNDRILVKDQSNATQNGIYYVTTVGSGANGTWTRATDADTGAKLPTNSYTFVNAGTTNGSTAWVMNTPGTIVMGTSQIVWVLFSQITQIPAANITGAIVGSQIAALSISTAKFAAGLTPVEIVSTVPTSSNFQGRMIFLTATDGSFAPNKLYRWTDVSTTGNTFWTAIVPATDITGQITTTQISDSGITTPKIASNAITTTKLSAGCVTANELAANSVIAGKIQAGAISATEIAVGTIDKTRIANGTLTTTQIAAGTILGTNIAAGTITGDRIVSATITGSLIGATTITGGNIATGTITADKLSVTNLSAINADLGTVTAGTISANVSINVGTATKQVQISSTAGLSVAAGQIDLGGSGIDPWIRVYGFGGAYATHFISLSAAHSGTTPPVFQCSNGSSAPVIISEGGIVTNGVSITCGSNLVMNGGDIRNQSSDGWTPGLSDGSNKISFQYNAGALRIRVGVTDIGSVTLGP